jgi:hypothetical protein
MRTMRRRRGGSSGGGVGRRCVAGDGQRETSPAVYDGVDIQACSEERLLLAAGEARRGGGDLGPRRPRKRRPQPPRRPRRRPWRAPPVQKKQQPRFVFMGMTRYVAKAVSTRRNGGSIFLTLEGCRRVLVGGEAFWPFPVVRVLLTRACVRDNVLKQFL